ncbi:MAG: GNAT family N-acetyltransferase [Methylocystis sp.]
MTAPERDEKTSFLRHQGRESTEISELLAREVASRHGPRDEKPLSIEARDAEGALLCGMNGVIHWRWLYVRHFWVAPEKRAQGFGRALMAEVESLARETGSIGIYLDTFEEGAARFYERLGFSRCGRIEDFPQGAARVFLAKRIAERPLP